jgi:hypothetical protein
MVEGYKWHSEFTLLKFSCDSQHILGYIVGNLWVSQGSPNKTQKKKHDHFCKNRMAMGTHGQFVFQNAPPQVYVHCKTLSAAPDEKMAKHVSRGRRTLGN